MTEVTNSDLDEISLSDLFKKIFFWVKYLTCFWKRILILSMLGGIIGLIYANSKPIDYSAKITFVVEEGKNSASSLGGLASLAGQFGVDVGGASGGVLSGDNILLYFRSTSLAREVLMSEFQSNSKLSIADAYVKEYKFYDKWGKNELIGNVIFPILKQGTKYTRLQDSLLNILVDNILKENFSVSKTDKKSSFIEVTTTMQNESLAKLYCEKVVQLAVDRYINIKTQRQKITVDKLQKRVDSISTLLYQKTVSGASLQTETNNMDINPLYRTKSAVSVETTFRDKTMLATIFASVTQNLELAKFTLSQETPVIQIVDTPTLPLKFHKVSKILSAISFSLIFFFTTIIYLITRKLINPMSVK